MASFNRRLIWNTRERLLSTDLNDATALLHAKGTDEVVGIVSGDAYKTTNPLSGVVAGLTVYATGGNLEVRVRPGIAFKHGTPATSLDSPYLKIELLQEQTIDLSAYVDAANPRWVAIEVAPADTAELVSTRDIFDPALGTFTPQNVDKIRRPEPVFTVTAAAPGPNPLLPTGTPGVMPLAYVYIDANATQIVPTDVVLCRPLLNSVSLMPTTVLGKGGLNVVSAGGTQVQAKEFAVKFAGMGNVSEVLIGAVNDAGIAGSPNWVQGEFLPATDQPVYAYLMAAPFPPGYDADVASNREFVDLSTRFPSNPTLGVLGGIIVWSTQAPAASDAQGQHPSATVQLNDATWAGGSVPQSKTAYLGAVSYVQSIAPAGFITQTTRGDRVKLTEGTKLPADFSSLVSPGNVAGAAGQFANLSPLLLNNGGKGLAQVLPDSYEWEVLLLDNANGNPRNYSYAIEPDGQVAAIDRMFVFESNSAGDAYQRTHQRIMRTNLGPGVFTWDHEVTGGGLSAITVATTGYRDRILAQR